MSNNFKRKRKTKEIFDLETKAKTKRKERRKIIDVVEHMNKERKFATFCEESWK